MKKYLPILISIMLFTAFLAGQVAFDLLDLPANPSSKEKKEVVHYESLFKSLNVKSIEGKAINLAKLKSPVVILNFWATWCTPCLEELPSLVKLDNMFDSSKLSIIGINTDDEGQLKKVQKALKKYNIAFPNVLDGDGTILDKFLISAIPVSIVFHRGKVVKISNGPMDFISGEFIDELKDLN